MSSLKKPDVRNGAIIGALADGTLGGIAGLGLTTLRGVSSEAYIRYSKR